MRKNGKSKKSETEAERVARMNVEADARKAAILLNKMLRNTEARREKELNAITRFIVGVRRGITALDRAAIPAGDFKRLGGFMKRVQKLSVRLEQVVHKAAQRAQDINEAYFNE